MSGKWFSNRGQIVQVFIAFIALVVGMSFVFSGKERPLFKVGVIAATGGIGQSLSLGALVAGGGLLLALAGAWVIGLPGVALGLVALAFWRRRRSGA